MLHFEITAWETLYNAFISRPEPRNGVQTDFEWDHYSQAVLLTIFDNVFQLLTLTYVWLMRDSRDIIMAFIADMTLASQSYRYWPFIDESRQRREAIRSFSTL